MLGPERTSHHARALGAIDTFRFEESTTRAAVIYQHQAAGRDQLIAAALGKLAEAELGRTGKATGTQRARI